MTSRYDVRGETPTITRRRHVLACARCRARRVKCDRSQPSCSNCSKAGALCQPAQQQHQLAPPSISVSSKPGRRDTNDKLRLSKLEEEVARLSKEVDSKSPSREPSQPGSPIEFGTWENDSQGKIIYGSQTRYIGPSSWACVPDEIADIRMMISSNDAEFVSSSEVQGSSSLRSGTQARGEPGPPLPNEQLHEVLLGFFSQRVDPLIRILHWPSFSQQSRDFRRRKVSKTNVSEPSSYPSAYFPQPTFDSVQHGVYSNTPMVPSQNQGPYVDSPSLNTPDSTFTALLYSVYYAALVSVIDSPNPPDLGPNINAFSLAATFKREVTNRVMLLDDGIARAESLEMLQAMVLYLSVEPSSFGSQLQWLQLGAAIKLAQSLGVHRDGTHFDLSPIQIETRRRLWAQICILDTRIAEHMSREPTISADSYDTALPLSVSDGDLSEIDEHDASSRQGKDSNFKTYQEIEQGLERQSPYSSMTFLLVEAEAARAMAQFFCRRYQPRDSIFYAQSRRSSSISRYDRSHWTSRLEHRFRAVYGLDELEATHPMQYLVSEMINLTLMKTRFVKRMLEWREIYSRTDDASRDHERDELLRDALVLSVRSLTLINQYSSSPYGWYTKRLRDVYVSSFIALILASDEVIDPEMTAPAWSVLSQLFPVDDAGRLVELAVASSALGRVLQKARMKTALLLQSLNAQEVRKQAVHSAAGAGHQAYPTTLTSSSQDTMGTFHSSGNMFEDFDAMMQEPLWSAGLSGVDNPFGNWADQTPRTTQLQAPPRPHSQPYEQAQIYPTPDSRAHPTFIATRSVSSQIQVNVDPSLTEAGQELESSSISQPAPTDYLCSSPESVKSALNLQANNDMITNGNITQEPLSERHLHLPSARNRSVSQPQPKDVKIWATDPKSTAISAHTGQESLRSQSYYGHDMIVTYSPHMMAHERQHPLSTYPVRLQISN